MRATQKLLGTLVFVGLVSLVVGNAAGQGGGVFTFDKLGNGIYVYNDGDDTLVVPGMPATVSGHQAMMYDTPLFDFSPGDVVLRDPTSQQPIDLIRFEGDAVYFLLEYPSGIELLSSVAIDEQVRAEDGAHGLFNHVPPSGQPGGVAPIPVVYNMISAVPEPSSVVHLLGFGAVSLASYGWRRWRA